MIYTVFILEQQRAGKLVRQCGAHAVDDVLHGERRKQNAEQARQRRYLPVTPSTLAQCAPRAQTQQSTTASTTTMTASRIARRMLSPPLRLGQQNGRSDRARSGHQRNGEREGGDIADVLLDGLFGLLRLALGAHAEHHFRGDREQQQPAGDAERRQPDRRACATASRRPTRCRRGSPPRSVLARSATLRRARCGRPCVIARKDGTRPIGSTTTSNVTSAEMRNSSGMCAAQGTRLRRVLARQKGRRTEPGDDI